MTNYGKINEQFKKDIICFLDTRFIPRHAPKSNNKKYKIEQEHSKILDILLEEDVQTVFHFYNDNGIVNFNAAVRFSDQSFVVTKLYNNLEEVFNVLMKLVVEHKIKMIFNKEKVNRVIKLRI